MSQIELRPFDEEDSFAFAGCESENPMIAYCRDFTLVVGGERAGIYRESASWTRTRTWTFPDHGTAMLFVLSVRGVEPDHILDLKAEATTGRLSGSHGSHLG